MNLIKRRFLVLAGDGKQMNIDEIKNKGLFNYDKRMTKKNYYQDENFTNYAEDLMIEMQDLMYQERYNISKGLSKPENPIDIRFSEILLHMYK